MVQGKRRPELVRKLRAPRCYRSREVALSGLRSTTPLGVGVSIGAAVSSGLSPCFVTFEAKPGIRLFWAVTGSPEFQRRRLTLVARF